MAIILALIVVGLVAHLVRQKQQIVALQAAQAGKGDALPKVAGTTAWGRFFDRWEWKPMRLPLLVVVIVGALVLVSFQDNFFAVFKLLVQDTTVGSSEWWGLAFGFFGACVATISGVLLLIFGIGAALAQDSPPPAGGQVPDSTVEALLSANATRDAAQAKALHAMADSVAQLAAGIASIPPGLPAPDHHNGA